MQGTKTHTVEATPCGVSRLSIIRNRTPSAHWASPMQWHGMLSMRMPTNLNVVSARGTGLTGEGHLLLVNEQMAITKIRMERKGRMGLGCGINIAKI
jgi:hypothetical protein